MDNKLEQIINLSSFEEVLREIAFADPGCEKAIRDELDRATTDSHRLLASRSDAFRIKCALYEEWMAVNKIATHYEHAIDSIEIMTGKLWKHALCCTENFFNEIEVGVDEFLSSKERDILKDLKGKHEWYSVLSDGVKSIWSYVQSSKEARQKATLVGEVVSLHLAPNVLSEKLEEIFMEAEKKYRDEWNKQIKQHQPPSKSIQLSDMDLLLSRNGGYSPSLAEITGVAGLASAAIGSFSLAVGWHTLSYALVNVFPPVALFALTASAGLAFLNKDKSLLSMEKKVRETLKSIRRQIIVDLNFKRLPELNGKTLRQAVLDESKHIVEEAVREWRGQVMGSLQPDHLRKLIASAKNHLLAIERYLALLDESIPEEHRKYLTKKNFRIRCNKGIFEPEEIEFIERYGYWLEALQNKVIEPLPSSERQKHFVQMCAGEVEPSTEQEKIWWRYMQRLKLEACGEYSKGA